MQSSQATENHNASALAQTLEEIAALDREIGTVSAQLDEKKKKRAYVESLAVEEMQTQRLGGVRVAGRSWRVEECLHLSVPRDRRDAVLEAARVAGIEDAITTVATSTLKSWLVERAKEAGRESGQPFADGTPFAGIVGEFVEQKLSDTGARLPHHSNVYLGSKETEIIVKPQASHTIESHYWIMHSNSTLVQNGKIAAGATASSEELQKLAGGGYDPFKSAGNTLVIVASEDSPKGASKSKPKKKKA